MFLMLSDLMPILFLGFGLGIIHALDADHVMALLALNNQKTRLRRVIFCSTFWAIGHGGVLLVCGTLLFGFGVIIPESFQWLAELSVGILLVILGVGCFWQFRKAKLHLHTHGDIQHVHWHTEEHINEHKQTIAINDVESQRQLEFIDKDSHQRNTNSAAEDTLIDKHKPLMIGMLHGLAGSAPVLALIPALNQGNFLLATVYLLLFSIGMMLSMIFFGLSFAYCQQYINKKSKAIFQYSRYLLALASIGFGTFWIFQASV